MFPTENFGEMGGAFDFIGLFIPIVFLIVFGLIAFFIIRGFVQWNRNNLSPLLTEKARVVSKRSAFRGGAGDSPGSTSYYVTFEFETGERIELGMSGSRYGLLAEGDYGDLSFQGTRYKGFQRQVG